MTAKPPLLTVVTLAVLARRFGYFATSHNPTTPAGPSRFGAIRTVTVLADSIA
jgi:hypothetical protein